MIPMPLIDAHTHVFPAEVIEDRARIAENDRGFALLYNTPSARMVDASGLRGYLSREGISRTIAVGFPFRDPGLLTLSNDCLLELAKADERIVPLVMVDLREEKRGIAELERCIGKGASGLGEVAFYGEGFSRSERERLDRVVAPLEEADLILMIHVNEQVGHPYGGKISIDFAEVVAFVEAHPRLKIILSHLGGGLCFYEFMPEIKKSFANVRYDLAAIPFLYRKDVYRFVGSFLSEKVLFGSDYPLLPANRYLPDIRELGEEVQAKILFSNAEEMLERTGLG
jgi:uncharacterized protein